MIRPDYQPELFGVPMEWDDEIGFWKDYAAVSVRLMQDADDTFAWQINSSACSGVPDLEQALSGIERELTRIRNAIPVAKGWHMENA